MEKLEKEVQIKNKYKKKLSAEELFAFSDEMHMMIASGVSSLEGITLMLEEAKDSGEKALLQQMQDTIYATGSFAMAVKDTEVFPEYYVYMIEIGEQTGNTDSVLRALGNHYEREHAIRRAIRSAVSYPLLMMTMMLVIITVLVTKIMPIFERVFIQLGSSMEGFSGGLLKVGDFIAKYGAIFVVIILLLIGIGIYFAKAPKGKKQFLNMVCKFKTFRSIYEKIMISRFASGMSMTISSGMDMMQALETAGSLVTYDKLKSKVQKCKDLFSDSTDMGTAFSESGIFTGLFGRMVVLSAKTGNMEQVMEKVADTYQDQADEEIHNLISIVEPTLVIVLSIIVGLILMSVMLPLLNIMSGIY